MAHHHREAKKHTNSAPVASDAAHESLRDMFSSLYRRVRLEGGQIDGSTLGTALQRLVEAEVIPGGPYRDQDGTVDPLANAYIAHFLARKGVVLPSLRRFTEQYSEAALITETLSAVPITRQRRNRSHVERYATLLDAVDKRVWSELLRLPEPLCSMGGQAFERLLRADTSGEIRLMPRLFLDSVVAPPRISQHRMTRLGTANVFFWISGMLFDDFLDGDGLPEHLPIAIVLHRRALALYRYVDADHGWHALLEEYCIQADQANAWEITSARAGAGAGSIRFSTLPNYDDGWPLAARSLGHLFGPLYILRQAHATRRQIAATWTALRHYLIVRQLNDDLRDWREDLCAGQITLVVGTLLSGSDVAPGAHPIDKLMPRLERHFFEAGLEEICALALSHLADADMLLANADVMKSSGGLHDLLDRQEVSIRAALATHADRRAFLRTVTAK